MKVVSLDYLAEQGITSSRVLEALRRVPRDRFVPEGERASAFANRPLSIGSGQTISQPFVVGYMTQALDLRPNERVLEVGTGSGYQTAVLAELSNHVYSIEILPELAERARAILDDLGYTNVRTRVGNGRDGWPEEAPFNAIMVTAAAERVPPALVSQLAPEGRMIVPVGPVGGAQELVLVRSGSQGRVRQEILIPVRFVPLTGGHDD
ncbi:MAG: protein-L-isoaspartate(D-aspartate) O-methyltransferase [Spirochaetota bacterium]